MILTTYIHWDDPPITDRRKVMELLEGPDLFDYLAARSCKLKEMDAICLVRHQRTTVGGEGKGGKGGKVWW